MKKIIFAFLALILCMTTKAQVDGFFPQFGQDTQWTVNEQFELVFSGVVAPAPAAAIATTFEGMVSDGIGGNDFTGLNIKFDGIIMDAPTSTKIFFGFNGTWGGKAVIVEFNQYLCQATVDYSYGAGVDKKMVTDFAAYQGIVNKNGYNAFEIDVNATGLISCKLNGFVCDVPFQAPLASLKPTAPSTFYVLFGNDIAGYKMKNLVATKGGVTNKYFSDPATRISVTSQSDLSVYPNPGNGVFTISSAAVGKSFKVSNILGQQVLEGKITSNNYKLNMTAQQKGVYFVSIDDVNGKLIRKIIKN